MTIDCTIDIGWMREGQVQYGANVQFNLPARVKQTVLFIALMESLMYAIEEMQRNATDADCFGVDAKVLNISVCREEKSARLSVTHKRGDDENGACDAIVDWVCGDSVMEVVR